MGDFFAMVLQSPGWIFGPLMLLAGLAAVVACARARDRGAARRALKWALVPPALGVLGALVGAAVWGLAGPIPAEQALRALAGTVLFGVFVALVPALWALALLRRNPPVLA